MALSAIEFQEWLESAAPNRCILVEVSVLVDNISTTLYLSNRTYNTGANETPANTGYIPCILTSLSYSQQIPLDGTASLNYGDIAIDNTNGVRDSWMGYIWANRPISIFVGDASFTRDNFTKIYEGYTQDIGYQSRDTINIGIRDILQRLNTPITETLIGGTGPNKERLKPLLFGEVHNITPVLVSPTTLTYMVHNGPIERIIEVRDNGVPLTDYTVDLNEGTFTLLKAPFGVITCSAQGEKTSIDLNTGNLAVSYPYSNTVAKLIGVIVRKYGTNPLPVSSIDLSGFSSFDTANQAPVGIYITENTNVIAVCQELAASLGAQFTSNMQGLVTLAKITSPVAGTRNIYDHDILEDSFTIREKVPVQASVKLGYCKNWTIQTNLLTGIPEEHKIMLGQEYLTATATNSQVKSAYGLSSEPRIRETLLISNTPTAYVTQEATRILELWSAPRHIYSLETTAKFLTLNIGQMLTVFHSRYGLSNGKPGQVVSMDVNWDTCRVKLEVLI